MDFDTAIEWVIRAVEISGVAVLVIGCVTALVVYVRDVRRSDRIAAYKGLRGNIGRTILLGLEILIVADIVQTVAIDSTLQSAVALGVIVLVRTFLSFSLEIELEGVVPWRRQAVEREMAADATAGATAGTASRERAPD